MSLPIGGAGLVLAGPGVRRALGLGSGLRCLGWCWDGLRKGLDRATPSDPAELPGHCLRCHLSGDFSTARAGPSPHRWILNRRTAREVADPPMGRP